MVLAALPLFVVLPLLALPLPQAASEPTIVAAKISARIFLFINLLLFRSILFFSSRYIIPVF